MYPVTFGGPVGNLGGGFVTGSSGYFSIYPYTGSGNGYINGGPTSAGNIPNTASGVGQYLRSGNSNVVAAVFGSIPSTSSFSVSMGGSGSTVSCTVTNNTSDWWYWVPFLQPNGGSRRQPFYTNYFDSGSNNQFTLQTNWEAPEQLKGLDKTQDLPLDLQNPVVAEQILETIILQFICLLMLIELQLPRRILI